MSNDRPLPAVSTELLQAADERAETHVSVLFFVGDRVYKQKKPVAMGFLDFTSAEARARACRREVELNRRLAPDVYLGVAGVVDASGSEIDHVVVMRRMPERRRLATLVRAGSPVTDELRRLARLIAAFHASPDTAPTTVEAGAVDSVRETWEASFDEMRRFVGPVLAAGDFDRVAALVRAYLDGRGPLFDRRIAEGRVCDGHGDLQADDIFCLDDGPRVLDCIEFDDRLRHGDVLADVGFLVMDLERLGHPELGATFLAAYEEFSGEHHPSTLAEHYIAARAHVRAKVACLRHEQGDEASADQARRLHTMALRHLESAQVPLVLVGGLPGTGKSTLATGLAADRGWALLRSDALRKDLAGLSPSRPAPAAFGEGLYAPPATAATYEAMIDRARALLEAGEPVILDASWIAEEHRDLARRAAREAGSPVVELSCDAPLAVVAERISGPRSPTEGVVSDASPDVAGELAERADRWPEAVSIDARSTPDEMRSAANAALDRALSGGRAADGGRPHSP